MPRRTRGPARAALLLVAALGTGCSLVQFAYNRLDWLIGHELSRYVDLDAAQDRQFRGALADLLAWHRRSELPTYARELRAVAGQATQPLTPEQVDGYTQRYLDLWQRIVSRALPAACALLATLDDAQVATMMREAQDDIDEFAEEFVAPGEADVREAAARKQIKTLGKWLGPLDTAQREQVRQWAQARPYLGPAWLDYRGRWRAAFGAALSARTAPGFCTRLEPLFLDPASLDTSDLRAASAASRQAWADSLSRLTATLSPTQRQHLRGQLLDLADDFDALSAPK